MSMHITDQEILHQMGLTDKELRDMEAKFSQLASGLDSAQIETLKQSMPTAESAARTFKPNLTPEGLTKFIRERAPLDSTMVVIFNGNGG